MNKLQYNPTPLREPYFIKDDKMVKLIKEIFITVDQSWSDTSAYELSKLIQKYIKENVK